MDRFRRNEFDPLREAIQRHMEADDRRFEQMTQAIGRISTAIEVSAATQQAQLAQTERIFSGVWTKVTIGVMALSPAAAILIALFKH